MQTAITELRWLRWQLRTLERDRYSKERNFAKHALSRKPAAAQRTCRCGRPVSTRAAAPSGPSADSSLPPVSADSSMPPVTSTSADSSLPPVTSPGADSSLPAGSGPSTPLPRRASRLPRAAVLTVREARPEEYWEVADTHCVAFFPEVNPVLGMILRMDRVFSLAGSTSDPRDRRKMALVALESGPNVIRDNSFVAEELSGVAPLRPFVAFASAGVPLPGAVFNGGEVGERGVIGTCTLDLTGEFLPRRKPRGKRRVGIAYVSNMAVRLRRRRQGVARILVGRAEAIAKSFGCRSLALHVAEDNVSAIALYEEEGFRRIKVPIGAVWPAPTPLKGQTLVMMMKRLGYPDKERWNAGER